MSEHHDDRFHLDRFVAAQAPVIKRVQEELSSGEKLSHWMWFIFPQVHGLGSSLMAKRFAIGSKEEAIAYLEHPVLGARLLKCTSLVNAVHHRTISRVFGYPDDLKFHSSVTLFAKVTEASQLKTSVFAQALAKFFDGQEDPSTSARWNTWHESSI